MVSGSVLSLLALNQFQSHDRPLPLLLSTLYESGAIDSPPMLAKGKYVGSGRPVGHG